MATKERTLPRAGISGRSLPAGGAGAQGRCRKLADPGQGHVPWRRGKEVFASFLASLKAKTTQLVPVLSAWEHRFLQASGALPVPSTGWSQLLGLLDEVLVHSSCGQRRMTWTRLFCCSVCLHGLSLGVRVVRKTAGLQRGWIPLRCRSPF